MNIIPANNLSPESRVWIYQSTRAFTNDEVIAITERIAQFVNQWTAHKQEVTGFGALLYNRFVVLMADESRVGVSGCSVDSSVHFIRSVGADFNAHFFDRWNLAYIKDGEVLSANREEFEKLVTLGEVSDDTTVFNNLVQTKADFEAKWQIPYKNSWLKNLVASHTPFSSVL